MMINQIKYSVTLIIIFYSAITFCQTSHKSLMDGDQAFDKKDFTTAEIAYRNAAQKNESAKAKFNLGNTLYEQGNYEASTEEFQRAANLSIDTSLRAKALFNKGNSLFADQKLEESLKAYRNSLLLNPNDKDVKNNYMLAKQQLMQQQEQEQQQQQSQEQEENTENQDEQQQKDQQEHSEEKKPEENDPEENQEQQDNGDEIEDEKTPKNEEDLEPKMTREEAMQLLEAAERKDSEVQKKIRKVNGQKKKPEKNW